MKEIKLIVPNDKAQEFTAQFDELLKKFGVGIATAQVDNRPVTERIKTFEDAYNELGEDDPLVMHYEAYKKADTGWIGADQDVTAFLKLRIICKALNEGWEPQFTEDEVRWYPWHLLWTADELTEKSDEWKQDRHCIDTGEYENEYAGFAYANSYYAPSYTSALVGSRLCLKSEALADYCGKQFIDLWADFKLIRRDD